MPYLIHHFLEASADSHPSKHAVVHGENRCTYLEIERRSNKIANWLIENGTRKGDRIAVLLRNSVEYICCYYAVLKAGGVIVPLNTGLAATDLGAMISDCTPRVLITEKVFLPIIENVAAGSSVTFTTVLSDCSSETPISPHGLSPVFCSEIYRMSRIDRPDSRLIDQDLAMIIYSSGSTGTPKGVTLSHLNVVSNTKSITSYLPIQSDDRCMVVLPFYYVYGKSLLNTHFSCSSTIVIDNRFAFPNAVIKTMIDEKITNFSGVPSTYSILLDRTEFATMPFPTLRFFTQAGGHLSSKYRGKLMAAFPDKDLFIMYGATEASARLAYLDPKEIGRRSNSCGRAIPNVEMKVVTESGESAGPGQPGEILARGSNVMLGYWNSPEETSRVLRNGWYYTGDLGFQDEDGFFYLTGRKRDMIKVGAFKVSAFEVEQVLNRCHGVQEAAVVAGPDDTLGENVRAFVVRDLQANVSSDEILQYCSDFLPKYKVPASIEFLGDMPRNEAGKVLKHKLPKMFSFD